MSLADGAPSFIWMPTVVRMGSRGPTGPKFSIISSALAGDKRLASATPATRLLKRNGDQAHRRIAVRNRNE